MTSYRRRLRDIAYHEQCVRELEAMVTAYAYALIRSGKPLPLIARGIKGTDFLTPYNSGVFQLSLTTHPEHKRDARPKAGGKAY